MKPPRRPVSVEAAAARYLAQRRGKAAFSGAPSAGRAAGKILKPLSEKFGPGAEALARHWPEIVGETLAQWCAPDSIRGGTLYVTARGPAAAVIEAESRRILQRVAQFAGKSAPVKIRIRQGRPNRPAAASAVTPPQKAETVRQGVETDPEARLNSALEKFGRGVRARES